MPSAVLSEAMVLYIHSSKGRKQIVEASIHKPPYLAKSASLPRLSKALCTLEGTYLGTLRDSKKGKELAGASPHRPARGRTSPARASGVPLGPNTHGHSFGPASLSSHCCSQSDSI